MTGEAAARRLRFALRTLLHGRTYGFAIAVLAVAIGMSAAVFSLAHAVLFRALPFARPDEVRVIWRADWKAGRPLLEMAYPELRDLQERIPAFDLVAVLPTTLYGYGKLIQFPNHDPVQLESAPVSHDFFRTLGVTPMLGRDFAANDEHPGAAPVAILSHSVWRTVFSGDRKIIGRQVTINGQGTTVIGVMGAAIDFPRGAGLWVPLGVNQALLDNRAATYLQAIARVKPGYSDARVTAQVNGLFRSLAKEFPGFYSPSQQGVVTPLMHYWLGSSRTQLLVSLGASLLLLVTGLITASNLFLSRTIARRAEIATRSSLGASLSQITAQFVVEGLTAALLAGAAGLALAWALVRLFAALAPSDIPRLSDAGLNWQVLLAAAALSLLGTLACSTAPAMVARELNLDAALREGGPRIAGTRRGHRLQSLFTVAQIAITVVLLAASLLVVVSVRAMLRADTGFANRDALTMNLAIRGPQSDAPHRRLFYSRLLERLRESPSIVAAGAVLVRPMEGSIGWDMRDRSEFENFSTPEEVPVANFEVVTPGYFQAAGTPLLEGRDFSDRDGEDAEHVVVVSRSVAQRIRSAGHEPLGSRMRLGDSSDGAWWKIAGVAADTRYRGVTTRSEDVYVSYRQTGIPVNYLVVRSRSSAADTAALVRKQVAALDATQAIANVATISQLIDRNTARQRFNMALLLTFGLGALVLAAAGVYSVIAESVAMRTREIAIRLALGADRPALVRNFAGGILRLVLVGECAGLAGALLAGRFFADLLYDVTPRDPAVLAGVSGFLLLISAAAASIPAWKASGQEPRALW